MLLFLDCNGDDVAVAAAAVPVVEGLRLVEAVALADALGGVRAGGTGEDTGAVGDDKAILGAAAGAVSGEGEGTVDVSVLGADDAAEDAVAVAEAAAAAAALAGAGVAFGSLTSGFLASGSEKSMGISGGPLALDELAVVAFLVGGSSEEAAASRLLPASVALASAVLSLPSSPATLTFDSSFVGASMLVGRL